MKNKIFKIIIVCLVVIGLFSIIYYFYNTNKVKNIKNDSILGISEWKTYKNEEYGFEFKLQDGWIQNGNPTISPDGNITILNFASPESQKSEYFKMYGGLINIWIYNNPKFLSVKEFFNGKIAPNIFIDEVGNIVKYNNVIVDGRDSLRVDGFPGGEGVVGIVIVNDKSRFIEIENKGKPIITDQILSTFKFIK
jgi:hypothetical protein